MLPMKCAAMHFDQTLSSALCGLQVIIGCTRKTMKTLHRLRGCTG